MLHVLFPSKVLFFMKIIKNPFYKIFSLRYSGLKKFFFPLEFSPNLPLNSSQFTSNSGPQGDYRLLRREDTQNDSIFIYSLNKYLSCAYHVPSTVLDLVNIVMNSTVYTHGGY